MWNALLTGSSGLDGPQEKLHYEEDFYTTLTLGFGGGMSVGTTYTAYTSPNGMFGTVHELAFKVAKSHWLAPYGLIAFELDGQADGGSNEGTYLELGVAPGWALGGGRATLSVPTKFGFSLNDYYEGADGDEAFGYFQIGGLLTAPISSADSKFGVWSVKGGVDFYAFGDTPKAFNAGDRTRSWRCSGSWSLKKDRRVGAGARGCGVWGSGLGLVSHGVPAVRSAELGREARAMPDLQTFTNTRLSGRIISEERVYRFLSHLHMLCPSEPGGRTAVFLRTENDRTD